MPENELEQDLDVIDLTWSEAEDRNEPHCPMWCPGTRKDGLRSKVCR